MRKEYLILAVFVLFVWAVRDKLPPQFQFWKKYETNITVQNHSDRDLSGVTVVVWSTPHHVGTLAKGQAKSFTTPRIRDTTDVVIRFNYGSEPVERHVPRRGVASADRSEPPTSFVRKADLRRQAEDVLPGVVETERAGVRTALLEQRAQRRLERLLRRRLGRDLRQTLREARGPRANGPRRLGGHSARPRSTLTEHRHGLDLCSQGATGVPPAGPRAVARRRSAARRPSRN